MLYPLFVMFLLTLAIFSVNLYWRISSIRKRTVHPRYFRLMQGDEIPPHILAGGRQMSHLFETPVLFYVAGVLAIVLRLEGTMMVGLAWAYVVLRAFHAVVHMTYNNVVHRLIVFLASLVPLTAMWILLVNGR